MTTTATTARKVTKKKVTKKTEDKKVTKKMFTKAFRLNCVKYMFFMNNLLIMSNPSIENKIIKNKNNEIWSITDIKEEHKGRKVVYKADSIYEKEVGVITSWNYAFVFVR